MNCLAAKPARLPAARRVPTKRCSFVEDLNWPSTRERDDPKKNMRRTETWAPGPNGGWEGVTPTLQ